MRLFFGQIKNILLLQREHVCQFLFRSMCVDNGIIMIYLRIIRCKDLALNIRDCLSLCLSEETLKAVGPFYLVSMPGEVKDPTSLHWKCVTCGLHILT